YSNLFNLHFQLINLLLPAQLTSFKKTDYPSGQPAPGSLYPPICRQQNPIDVVFPRSLGVGFSKINIFQQLPEKDPVFGVKFYQIKRLYRVFNPWSLVFFFFIQLVENEKITSSLVRITEKPDGFHGIIHGLHNKIVEVLIQIGFQQASVWWLSRQKIG